jgi:flagellar biosynthetic protein FliR
MTNILVTDFIIVLLIFIRIISAFIAAPIFGHKAFPVIVKISIAFVIAYIIFLVRDNSLTKVEFGLWWLAMNSLKEIVAGLIIGFSINLVFYGLSFAGSIIGFDMGLSMAHVFNPLEEADSNIIGEAIYLAAILIFFLINGHHYLIRALEFSFTAIPLGEFVFNQSVYDLLIKYSVNVFVIAIKISAPILISFFLVHIAGGIIARVIPQMQIFFVMQPLKIGLGFILLFITMPLLIYAIKNLLKSFEDNLYTLIRTMGT